MRILQKKERVVDAEKVVEVMEEDVANSEKEYVFDFVDSKTQVHLQHRT